MESDHLIKESVRAQIQKREGFRAIIVEPIFLLHGLLRLSGYKPI